MKTQTILKVLKRYSKSLNVMACDCKSAEEENDKLHFQFDKRVFDEAIKIIEKLETERA